MKFKVGDKVSVEANPEHDEGVGVIVEVDFKSDSDELPYRVCFNGKTSYWIAEIYLELLEETLPTDSDIEWANRNYEQGRVKGARTVIETWKSMLKVNNEHKFTADYTLTVWDDTCDAMLKELDKNEA